MDKITTCVSMDCPFLSVCRYYNFEADRSGGCNHQKFILEKAAKLNAKKPETSAHKKKPCR